MGKEQIKQLLDSGSSTYQNLLNQYIISARIWTIVSIVMFLIAMGAFLWGLKLVKGDTENDDYFFSSPWWVLAGGALIVAVLLILPILINISHLIAPDVSMLQSILGDQ